MRAGDTHSAVDEDSARAWTGATVPKRHASVPAASPIPLPLLVMRTGAPPNTEPEAGDTETRASCGGADSHAPGAREAPADDDATPSRDSYAKPNTPLGE